MAASDYLESGILNHIFRGATFSKPSNVSIALTTNIAQDSGGGSTMSEVADTAAYQRVNLGAPANADWTEVGQQSASGIIDNVAAIQFPQATAAWGFVSGFAVLDVPEHGSLPHKTYVFETLTKQDGGYETIEIWDDSPDHLTLFKILGRELLKTDLTNQIILHEIFAPKDLYGQATIKHIDLEKGYIK